MVTTFMWWLPCGVAGERMVPLLPCASTERMRDFFVPLGFTVGYQQARPNP